MKTDKALEKVMREYGPAITALGSNMSDEQNRNMLQNVDDFKQKYTKKYREGQKAHGGDMWTMGAYQVLENMEEEVLDQWSYARQIRKVLDEINDIVVSFDNADDALTEINKIMHRQKDDGEKK